MAGTKVYGVVGILFMALVLKAAGCSQGGTTCEQECGYYYDCPGDQDCIHGCCSNSRVCTTDPTCQPGGLCVEGRCVHLCINDTDCPAEASCIYGFCEPYPQDVYQALHRSAPDEGWKQKKPLQVGVGDVPLYFPMGVSMAGYGGRLGTWNPYRCTLGGSDSMFDRPRAKAFAFDNGLRRIVIIKAPMGWSDDFMATHVAWRVYQATGENYLNRMVFSAPHSHSHPGRFWNVLPEMGIGVLGHGDFSFEIFHHISTALTEATLAAIEDLKPARFGYAVMDPMDPEGQIHVDRRNQDQDSLDDSLVVMRIDDADGNLRAVLVNLALHGTHFNSTTISQDAPGAVELIAQQNLQEEFGLPVKVAFLSGNSGDVAPTGDGPEFDDWRSVQEVGVRTWPKVKQLVEALEGQTVTDVELDIANRRVPINREALGYVPDEYYDIRGNPPPPCTRDRDCSSGLKCIKGYCAVLYHFGSFQCVMPGDDDPSTKYEDGHLGCIFSTEMLSDGRPIPQFNKARLSVLRIGNLGLATIPGEPLSQYGRDAAGEMMNAGFEYATILGYSQDHHLYLMHADNWFQGGYEPSMDIWGWREGDYLFEKITEMIQKFGISGGYLDNAEMKPTWFDAGCASDGDCPLDTIGDQMICGALGFCIVAPTPTSNPGSVLSDVPDTVERIGLVRFVWTGGHPGVDLPRMILEVENGGTFEPATNAASEVYSDDGFTTMLWYRGDYENDHTWELSWEESVGFPTGRYRIREEGHYYDGSATQAYTTYSRAFDFVPCSRMIVEALDLQNDRLSGVVWYPSGPTNNDGISPFESLKPTGFLRHTGLTPPTMPWPLPTDGSAKVRVTIQPPAGAPVEIADIPLDLPGQTDYTFVSSRDTQQLEITSQKTLPSSGFQTAHNAYRGAGPYAVTVEATDAQGNKGSIVRQFQLE